MLTAHYSHRLPIDHDLDAIRARARTRGALWDDAPDLFFKGFLLRTAGNHGAIENSYSSLYLWRSEQAFADFLLADRYSNVTRSFGRARIDTRVVLDACRGSASTANFVLEDTFDIARDADLGRAFNGEVQHNRAAARGQGVVAAVTALDTVNWRFSRFLLTESALHNRGDTAVIYEILYLASPLLHSLPEGDAA